MFSIQVVVNNHQGLKHLCLNANSIYMIRFGNFPITSHTSSEVGQSYIFSPNIPDFKLGEMFQSDICTCNCRCLNICSFMVKDIFFFTMRILFCVRIHTIQKLKLSKFQYKPLIFFPHTNSHDIFTPNRNFHY